MVTTSLSNGAGHRMMGFVNGVRSVCSGQGWSTQRKVSSSEAAKRWEGGLHTLARSAMVIGVAALAGTAYAQAAVGGDGASALCEVAKWLKTIATTAGLIALEPVRNFVCEA